MIRIAEPDIGKEEEDLVHQATRSGRLAQGPLVERLEDLTAEMAGTESAIAVCNGTASLELIVEALGIGPGDEVITTPFRFAATLNVIIQSGATPRFVEIGSDLNIDPDALRALIGERTRGVIAVHLYGAPADAPRLLDICQQHGLLLIEDAAQAHGATISGWQVGSFGVGSFSFYATKNVAAGEGGAITTSDGTLVEHLRLLRNQGMQKRYPVHLYGLPVDMLKVMQLAEDRGWFVLEDASQAHGASVGGRPVGSFGHASAFSCYPTKNLGAWGDAGFVCGNDPEIKVRVRALRHHGQTARHEHMEIGGTDRLDNLQALVLTEKLRHLESEVRARQQVAAWYREALGDLDLDVPGDRGSRQHVFHQFVVRVPNRDRIRQQLNQNGVETSVHYSLPIHLQPAAANVCEIPVKPERAEAWAPQLLGLPMYASLTQDEVIYVAEALKRAIRI